MAGSPASFSGSPWGRTVDSPQSAQTRLSSGLNVSGGTGTEEPTKTNRNLSNAQFGGVFQSAQTYGASYLGG